MFQQITEIFLQYGFLVTKAQATRLLGVTRTRIKQMIREEKIKSVMVLDTEMIKFSDLQKWIQQPFGHGTNPIGFLYVPTSKVSI